MRHVDRRFHFGYRALLYALSLKRPHAGNGVKKLSAWIRTHLKTCRVDAAGNIHIDLRKEPSNRTLFVAHMDTVHKEDGANRYRISGDLIHACAGVPLGADDAAGIGVLMHLIDSNVHAYYIFTQGEEVGGIGAKFIREHQSQWLTQFDRAIAFDRKDTSSVITHQGMRPCCSQQFGESLVDALNGSGLLYMTDDTGSYTDTAEFCDVIAECTNISVGYFAEHTPKERLSRGHFLALCEAATKIDWDALPVVRDPAKPGDEYWFDTFDDDPFFELEFALQDALRGRRMRLIELLIDMYPRSDRSLARQVWQRARLNSAVLEEALQMLKCGFSDPYDTLFFIIDAMESAMPT